ncbi:cytochrome P450 [Xylariaceae sp. FL1019]|nr:cytochrome P450 [Xylariaceae sp. FL1019]
MEAYYHAASSPYGNGTLGKNIDGLLKSDVVEYLGALSVWQGLLLLGCLFLGVEALLTRQRITVANAPVLGYKSWLEPTFFFKLRYAWSAHKIIKDGYKDYNLNDKPFVLRRQDHDVTILPNKYVTELRSIPQSKLSRGRANFLEWGDQWAMKTLWSHSEWPIKAISENKNGQQAKYLESIREELKNAWAVEMPQADDWKEVDHQHIIRMILVRVIGKMIVGETACRSPEWLDLAENFTEDFVAASLIMRLLPPVIHPLITNIIPQRWRLRKRLRIARTIVDPIIARHEEVQRKRKQGIAVEEEECMLNWILNNADDRYDYVTKNMEIIMLVILVPAAHTTAMAISNILFDLCVYPEWAPKLRNEVQSTIDELGPLGEGTPVKDWISRLELLDSFFNESQRLSQPISITPNRYAMEDVTFKDGLFVPKGSLLGFVSIHNQIDPQIAPEPERFDPLRSLRKRQSGPDEREKNLAGLPSRENFAFGYGSQACPGRHIAVNVLKMVTSKLVTEYEFKSPPGRAGKPNNIHLLEFIFPDPAATIMMRKRPAA